MAYEGMTDVEVLERAKTALKKAASLPVGSVARSIQWGIYNTCSAELDRRVYAFTLARIRENGGRVIIVDDEAGEDPDATP